MGPNGDAFTPLFLISLASLALCVPSFIGGLIAFYRKNTFLKDQNARRRMASTRPVVIEDDKFASDMLTGIKKGFALMKGLWTGLDPAIGLFFKTQIPTLLLATISVCTMSGAIFDLLWK